MPQQALCRVSGRIFRRSSDFKRASRNFVLTFVPKQQPKKLETISGHIRKCCLDFDDSQKRYSSRDAILLI
jgi:hypothetical protein